MKNKKETTDYITFKVYGVPSDIKRKEERLADEAKRVAVYQKELRKWWAREVGDKKFILLVDTGSAKVKENILPFVIQLHQHNMDAETQRYFKLGAAEEMRKLLFEESL